MVTDHTLQAMDRKHITAMVLIDLLKAFDSLCHLGQLNKLTRLGTLNKALLWFQSYLTNRQQCTGIATSLSEPLTLTHRVPRGSILGPMLFAVQMNDLPEAIKSSNIESSVDVLDKGFGFMFTPQLLKISITLLTGAVQITYWLTQTRPSCCYLG